MKKMLGETGRGFYGHKGRPGKRGGSLPAKAMAYAGGIEGGRARFAAWSKQHSAQYWKDVFAVVKRSERYGRKARAKASSKRWKMVSKTLGQ